MSRLTAVKPPTSASAPGTACTAVRRRATVCSAAVLSAGSASVAWIWTMPSTTFGSTAAPRVDRDDPYVGDALHPPDGRRHLADRVGAGEDEGRAAGAGREVGRQHVLPDDRVGPAGEHLRLAAARTCPAWISPRPEREQRDGGEHPDHPGAPADQPGHPAPDPALRHRGPVAGDQRPERPPAAEHQQGRQQRQHHDQGHGDADGGDRTEAPVGVQRRQQQAEQAGDDGAGRGDDRRRGTAQRDRAWRRPGRSWRCSSSR